MNAAQVYQEALFKGLQPDSDLSLAEWANEHVVLNQKGAAEAGPYRIERTPFLKEIAECLSAKSPVQRIVFMKSSQIGGPLHLDTKVATAAGWSKISDIEVGDMVFDEQGRSQSVTGTSETFENEYCYRVAFDDGSEVLCDPRHLWTVERDLFNGEFKIQTLTTDQAYQDYAHGVRRRYRIPIAEPLDLPPSELMIRPYTFGAWIGDGQKHMNRITTFEDDAEYMAETIRGEGYRTQFAESEGRAKQIVIDPRVRQDACKRGHVYAEVGKTTTGRCKQCARDHSYFAKYGKRKPIRVHTFSEQIRDLKVLRNKHIPIEYLRGSLEQRWTLLRGLMDTDGYANKDGLCEFYSKDRDLAESVQNLVCSLGLRGSLKFKPRPLVKTGIVKTAPDMWLVRFTAYQDQPVFGLKRKQSRLKDRASGRPDQVFSRRIKTIERVAGFKTKCISVDGPSRLFLVGNELIPTHNSQLGYNWLGYIMHMVPGPVLMVVPDLGLAEKISKQRIAPMLKDIPVLSQIMSTGSREKENKILLKEFRGGFLVMAGANSGPSLRSMPIRYVFFDEVSAFPADCGEGDPVALAEKRTTTYNIRKKIFLNSTPLIKDACRIEAEYENSDRRHYYVPCPYCGAMQWLQWKQIKWEHEDAKTTRYECEHCHGLIKEHHKTEMLRLGEWRAEMPENTESAGFHISALYSPVGWTSWEAIVREFLKVRKDAPGLKQFTNSVLGETWEENSHLEKLSSETLKDRAEDFGLGFAPEGVVAITAGVDVQDNRLAIVIYGWGKDEESWVLDHQEILGSPAKPELWKQLEDLLDEPIEHETHADMKIDTVAIDSGGHFTHEVYQFTRFHRNRGKDWFAVKGSSVKGHAAIGKPRKVDINIKGQALKGGAVLHMVGTDTVKDVIYGRLKHNEPGQGYIHFSDELTVEFFDQLTAEKKVTRYVRGFPVKEYAKKAGARNEALDCSVYAYAALQKLLARYNRNTVWTQLENKLVPKTQVASNRSQIAAAKAEQAPSKVKRGFVQGW